VGGGIRLLYPEPRYTLGGCEVLAASPGLAIRGRGVLTGTTASLVATSGLLAWRASRLPVSGPSICVCAYAQLVQVYCRIQYHRPLFVWRRTFLWFSRERWRRWISRRWVALGRRGPVL